MNFLVKWLLLSNSIRITHVLTIFRTWKLGFLVHLKKLCQKVRCLIHLRLQELKCKSSNHHTLKWKGRQCDSPGIHWRRWRQASTSPVNTRVVILTTIPFGLFWTASVLNNNFGNNHDTKTQLETNRNLTLARTLTPFTRNGSLGRLLIGVVTSQWFLFFGKLMHHKIFGRD